MKGKSGEQIEAELREQFEAAYKEKIKTMYAMFELKYQTLNDSILSVFDRIKRDQLLSTMLNDRTTSAHMQDRIREIFSEVVAEERELIFKRMGTQITNLKFENEELRRKIEKLKQSNDHLEKGCYSERVSFEHANDELRRTKEANNFITRERQDLNKKSKDLIKENDDLKEILSSLRENYQQLAEENKEIDKCRAQIKTMKGNIETLKAVLVENQQKFERKYQSKKKEYKQKIEQYKTVINHIRSDKSKSDSTIKQSEADQIDTNKKLTYLTREHERKLVDLRSDKDREKSQMERKYDYKMKETQSYFEKMLQKKVIEIEENTNNYFQKIKEEGSSLERRIQLYQENYISLQQYHEEIGTRDELLMEMRKKLEAFEVGQKGMAKNQQILLSKLREAEMAASQCKQRSIQLEQLNQQIVNKMKAYEHSINLFKISQKKVKEQFEQYERIVNRGKEQNESLKHSCIKLEEGKSQCEISLREKERKIKDSNEELEILEKRLKKSGETIENLTKQRDNLSQSCSQLKKKITNLQYKMKDNQLTTNLSAGSWESRLSSLQLEIKEKMGLLTELQNKYQETSNCYQEQKKNNYQMESSLRKCQMELKFYKEAGSMQKNQLQVTLEEMKKVIHQKNEKIQRLQLDNDSKTKRLNKVEEQTAVWREKIFSEKKTLITKLSQLSKTVVGKLESLRREARLIKEYLSSREVIIRNDEAIFMSTFYKEMVQFQMYNQKEKQLLQRKLKEQMAYSHNNDTKILKNELDDKLRVVTERLQYQKSLLQQEIKIKDERVDELSREVKKSQIQAKKEREECRNMEKQLQLAASKLQQQKQHYEQKLKEMMKEMREEKQMIIKEYSDKKTYLQQQICQLVNTLKQLKTETQLIQAKHEEEKLVINAQLRTVKEQEEAIQKAIFQKDLEMQKCQKSYQAIEQAKRGLQNQIRGYMDTLNRKIQLIHQLQLKENQLSGENNLIKSKCERISEESSELKRKLTVREEQLEESLKARAKIESQLKDIKGALQRSNKNQQLRHLSELSMETLQLSHKVNEMRKVNALLDTKTPLRS